MADDAIRAELEALRVRLRTLDDLDLQTGELVATLAETVRGMVELRAAASLEMSASLRRVDDLLEERTEAQRRTLTALRDDIGATQLSAANLTALAASLEMAHVELAARVTSRLEPVPLAPPLEPAEPPIAPETAVAPVPGPTAERIVLRFAGIDTPATALSIQRFVSRIPGVVAVTGRQLAGTALRLDVAIRGDLLYDDLLDWPGGELLLTRATEADAELRVARIGAGVR